MMQRCHKSCEGNDNENLGPADKDDELREESLMSLTYDADQTNDGVSDENVQSKPRAKSLNLFISMINIWESIRVTVFVIGGALIVLIAARNTITWYLQKLWGASGDFWQSNYELIFDYCERDPLWMAFIGTAIVTNLTFFGFNSFFMFLDIFGKPAALTKYKVQPAENVPMDLKKFLRTLRYVILNQIFLGGPFIYATYVAYEWRGCDFGRTLPTFHWVVIEIAIFSVVEEVFFYYCHRLLHHPKLYKHIHKVHHEWTAPIGITAIYAHPVEHVLSNLLPPVLGPLLLGSHVATSWLWFCIALLSTTVAHCGYHFPFLPSPEAHDFHHKKFVNNFGVLGILDHLHGTDSLFLKSNHYQRHYLSLSLTPVSVLHPDQPPTCGKYMEKLQKTD